MDNEQLTKERWGHTEAYLAVLGMTKESRNEQDREAEACLESFFAGCARCNRECGGVPNLEASYLAEALRQHITEFYVPCTMTMLAELGQIVVEDERLRQRIDRYGEGTAAFLSRILTANTAEY